ncbi:MAG TPA: TIGR02300 family protein [Tepidisphaeraceae bacterium]|nr:TIGR02300 family protein [Tepidisphaeraceae bacterium]
MKRPAEFKLETTQMVKPEWGTKRTCPKCSTRFYDLGKEDPVHCIECGTDFVPEPVLKSKQPLAFEVAPAAAKEPAPADDELAADDLVDEDAEVSPDEEVDLETGDDDLGVETGSSDEDS